MFYHKISQILLGADGLHFEDDYRKTFCAVIHGTYDDEMIKEVKEMINVSKILHTYQRI